MKPLCYAPWINLLRKNKDIYAPCCVSERRHFNSYEDYKTSEWLLDIKEKLIKNEWPAACNYCRLREEQNITSDRIIYDERFNSCNVEIDEIDFPSYIDLRFSNTCNLKCRMCSPYSSSKIQNEYDKDKKSYEEFYGNYYDSSTAESFNIRNRIIKRIKLLGGEPTVDIGLHKFIKDILSKNVVEEISFTTNGTNLNKHFMNIIKPVKRKSVIFSVDAVEKTYEYIRTNAKWRIVNKNINHAFEKMEFSSYGFNVVLTPYIVFNINILFDWFLALHTKKYKFFIDYDDSNVSFTSLSCLTEDHLIFLKQSIYDWIIKHPANDVSFIYNNAIKIIENVVSNESNRNTFIRYNNYLDLIRNTDITALDTRFKEYKGKINYIS